MLKKVVNKEIKLNFIIVVLIFLVISANIFAKKETQATCGLGSGGSVLGGSFKYQQISNYRPFVIQCLSKKTKDSNGDYQQQYKRIINLELTTYPGNKDTGSQFAIITVEDAKAEE